MNFIELSNKSISFNINYIYMTKYNINYLQTNMTMIFELF